MHDTGREHAWELALVLAGWMPAPRRVWLSDLDLPAPVGAWTCCGDVADDHTCPGPAPSHGETVRCAGRCGCCANHRWTKHYLQTKHVVSCPAVHSCIREKLRTRLSERCRSAYCMMLLMLFVLGSFRAVLLHHRAGFPRRGSRDRPPGPVLCLT